MAGSGTTLALARNYGHHAIGIDTDPLAVLISKTWCADVSSNAALTAAKVLDRAKNRYSQVKIEHVLNKFDQESAQFIKFWFDAINIKQLWCLSNIIQQVPIDI